jgi:hypothetical protein
MTFTSGAANGYSINIAWKAADFTSSESSKTSGSSSSTSGSGSSSSTSGSSGAVTHTDSSSGGLGQGSKIGLGVGLGLGLTVILLLVGAWLFRRRIKARSRHPIASTEKGMPELDGNGTTTTVENNLPELNGGGNVARSVPELDGVLGGMPELETKANAAELDGRGVIPPRELDSQAELHVGNA